MGPTVRELCPNAAPWFALSVKHQHEFAVRSALEFKGYEVFLPTCRVKKRWSDRIKQLELPVFSGYVFARVPLEERVAVLETPGVIRLVGFNGRPAAVPEQDIQAIQQALGSGLAVRPWPRFEAGARVRIEQGPLRGIEGVVVREKNSYQLVIGVEMLCRFMAVEVDPQAVTAAAPLQFRTAV